jgi:transaldolase / glucose-6-phosphate isomerase
MKENSIKKLQGIRYSVWLDNLSRHLINSGELQRLITEGITGITSNPTIFQKAISGSKDYDASIRALIAKGLRNEKEIFLGLAVEDIAKAADLLSPVYQQSKGLDGYVSIEVSPDLAYDAEKTVAEARQLFSTIGRKNILIKVPATKPGIPAIKQLTAEGVNVNVTLLFSVNRYLEVAEAYLQGLEERNRGGKPVQDIASVASFFVSRVDTMIDPLLQNQLTAAPAEAEKQKIKGYLGKAAVANARLAYRKYREFFSGRRFQALKGARIQRILWGSTGTKNPAYSDVKYVEELIGPDAINTLPEATLKAFMDHGKMPSTIENHLAEAEKLFPALKSLGIDIDQVTAKLEEEGVKLFADSFFSLLKEIAAKRDSFLK